MICKRYVTAAAVLMMMAVSAQAKQTDTTLELSGTDWFICRVSEAGPQAQVAQAPTTEPLWVPAQVPGNIQADLETAHRLKPLWYGLGDPALYEVPKQDWWYRKDFNVPATFKGQRLTLVFDGVDFECEVYLNAHQIGRHAGMFRRFWFDVTEQVKPGEINKLAVKVFRGPADSVAWIKDSDNVWGQTGFTKHITATLRELKDLKSPTNYGYDWGVNIYTLGIWKDVRLEATGPTRIEWVRTSAELSEDLSQAQVKVIVETDSTGPFDGKLVCLASGSGRTFNTEKTCSLKQGENILDLSFAIDNPALWWPNGQGDQPLYDLTVRLVDGKSQDVCDERNTRFGVRRIEWTQLEGVPEDFINPFQLIINNRPVRTIGSNIIPPDLLFGRIDAKIDMLIEHARCGGLNTLRMWGGGVIMPQRFYDLADENGIMLIQEFPFGNTHPPRDEVFLSNLEATVVNIIKQLGNHPSIIEWSGGNEMPWKQGDDHPVLVLMRRLVHEYDSRIWRATCPIQGSHHGPWWYYHDSHYAHYNNLSTMRHGEFGTHEPAHLEVWQREIPPSAQWPIEGFENPYLVRKNVVRAVFAEHFWLARQETDKLFGPLENLEQLVRAGQFLGAEGLRYAGDSHRLRGRRIGGFTTWDYNEPWPNGAGTYLIDYDGRPTMEYHFYKQAIAPVALSLRHDTIRYDPAAGINTQLWLVNDSPSALQGLQWQWLARDRTGRVFASNKGQADAQRIEPLKVDNLALNVPTETCLGPIFVEMALRSADGALLHERFQIFGLDKVTGPWRGLLVNQGPDEADDAAVAATLNQSLSAGTPDNLAYVGNAAQPATASSEHEFAKHKAVGLNDGNYGNDCSWISHDQDPTPSFVIELAQPTQVSRFKLGRDRTGRFDDRPIEQLRLETSLDGRTWQTVFQHDAVNALEGYSPAKTMVIHVAPVQAAFVKATVQPNNACIDEFEVYSPKEDQTASPGVAFEGSLEPPLIFRPVQRTTLHAAVAGSRCEGDQDVLQIELTNTGRMTALFCEPHPLIEYRTDLFIENNHCFIPPGESRTVTLRASSTPAGGLSLAQTGWRLSCWNADDVVIETTADLLLALGRRDRMCREYKGYFDPDKLAQKAHVQVEATRPDPAQVPYLLDADSVAKFKFPLSDTQAKRPARLLIHAADQSAKNPTKVLATINGRTFEGALPSGLGIQQTDPAHLAFPATVEFPVPTDALRVGNNVLEVRIQGHGWFSWDAMVLAVTVPGTVVPDNTLAANAGPMQSGQTKAVFEAVKWLENESHRIIRASKRTMQDGTAAFPPQVGIGYEAFWLRDYQYTLEGAVDAYSNEELTAACRMFVRSMRADGAGVDCVKFDGTPIYMPGYGSMGANPVADGSQFTVGVAWHTYRKTRDRKLLEEIIEPLIKTMNAVPRHPETRLVHIVPGDQWDRCPYGFTDTVRKQGDVLFCSLLYVQASRRLSNLLSEVGRNDDAQKWKAEAKTVAASIRKVFWDPQLGLFRAATVRCKEPDIWGSAFAVYLAVANSRQSMAVASYFNEHYAQIVQHGQIRHLPGAVYWEQAGPPDTYQNGAFWATPTGWFVYTLDLIDPNLADQTILDMVADFRQAGACEWIFGTKHQLPNYLASPSLPLAGIRAMLQRRQRSDSPTTDRAENAAAGQKDR